MAFEDIEFTSPISIDDDDFEYEFRFTETADPPGEAPAKLALTFNLVGYTWSSQFFPALAGFEYYFDDDVAGKVVLDQATFFEQPSDNVVEDGPSVATVKVHLKKPVCNSMWRITVSQDGGLNETMSQLLAIDGQKDRVIESVPPWQGLPDKTFSSSA